MTHYHIYGIGAALVDTEITVQDSDLTAMAVAKGVMTLVDEPRQAQLIDYLAEHQVAHKASGGSGANTIIAASYFGCDNFYSCKVANDDNGRFYLQDIKDRSEEHTSELQSRENLVCRLLLEKKKLK